MYIWEFVSFKIHLFILYIHRFFNSFYYFTALINYFLIKIILFHLII